MTDETTTNGDDEELRDSERLFNRAIEIATEAAQDQTNEWRVETLGLDTDRYLRAATASAWAQLERHEGNVLHAMAETFLMGAEIGRVYARLEIARQQDASVA